ncbi:MAG TPA: redoxin domain-containing protein [Candidatus Wunengus sp. YC60]|uniref:redoxin domain-containing protein n=1 Tax=Candidatus Wunengus sp. YC60 TaxID=3367697 RepID=UPI004028F1F5
MKKRILLGFTVITSVFFILSGYAVHAGELKHDATAAKKLEIIRRNLSGLTEMKSADAKKYYNEALNDLSALIGKYDGTEEALEAKFFMGAAHNEMHNFDEAIKCFDSVLGQGNMERNFKARTLYFKTKALLGKGDIATAKEVVAELRMIEPRAAEAFSNELGGMLRIGMEAPTFNVADVNGNPVDLSKYKGNIIIIDFWATWSDPCIQEFPNVKKMYAKFKGKGVQFLGVSLDDDIEDLRGFVKQFDVEWPQIFDGKRWAGEIPSLYHIQATPTMYVLDRENKVRYIGSDTESITRIVTTLLSESKDMPLFR